MWRSMQISVGQKRKFSFSDFIFGKFEVGIPYFSVFQDRVDLLQVDL